MQEYEIGVIVGSIVGGVFLGLCALLGYLVCCKREKYGEPRKTTKSKVVYHAAPSDPESPPVVIQPTESEPPVKTAPEEPVSQPVSQPISQPVSKTDPGNVQTYTTSSTTKTEGGTLYTTRTVTTRSYTTSMDKEPDSDEMKALLAAARASAEDGSGGGWTTTKSTVHRKTEIHTSGGEDGDKVYTKEYHATSGGDEGDHSYTREYTTTGGGGGSIGISFSSGCDSGGGGGGGGDSGGGGGSCGD